MNQRLVWNFEINLNPPLDFHALSATSPEPMKWEARFFWPHDSIIILLGLDESFLILENCTIKNREDIYLLLPNSDRNIKLRHGEWFYKPKLSCYENFCSYGKKIHLNTAETQHLERKTHKVTVYKTAIRYKLPTTPKISLELSRIKIDDMIYFSACLEGKSLHLVKQLANYLLDTPFSCDYVSFLKKTLDL